MEVLTVKKELVKGDYTYSLMSNENVHINNHKTNKNSVMVPAEDLRELLNKPIKG